MSIIPSFPYTLANGTTADASQVMADFLQIQTDVNTFAAPLASPAFTGLPTAPTPLSSDSSGSLATTAFVANAIAALTAVYAPIASPTFTGTVTAPTLAVTGNATIAGTLGVTGTATLTSAVISGNTSIGGALSVTGAATLGSGSVAVTQALTDNSTKIATDAFVQARTTPNVYQATPSNPAGTSSASAVMMGLAGSITPNTTGDIMVVISGAYEPGGSTNGGNFQITYGTGTAPVNGAAASGTGLGALGHLRVFNTSLPTAFVLNGIANGLTIGTTYWIDISVISGGGTCSLQDISISAYEIK